MKDLTEKDLGIILMSLNQQANKLKYQHNEYLKIDPDYEGPMVGQSIYDNLMSAAAKIEKLRNKN